MTTPTPKDNPPFDPPVFCSGIERDCKHGQLARSCDICELERALAGMTAAWQNACERGDKAVRDLAAAQAQLAQAQEDRRVAEERVKELENKMVNASYNSKHLRERAQRAEALAAQNANLLREIVDAWDNGREDDSIIASRRVADAFAKARSAIDAAKGGAARAGEAG